MKEINMPKEIETERLFLKKSEPSHADIIFSAVESNRSRLKAFMPWVGSTNTVEDTKKYIKRVDEQWQKNEIFDFGLFDKKSDEYLGNIGLHAIAMEHNRCEIGYWITKSAEGKGFVSEAVEALEKECFGLGFNRIEIRCSPTNVKSQNIPKRLGYKLEGVLKKNFMIGGLYQDTMVFAKLYK